MIWLTFTAADAVASGSPDPAQLTAPLAEVCMSSGSIGLTELIIALAVAALMALAVWLADG